jgi:hypothetical protein
VSFLSFGSSAARIICRLTNLPFSLNPSNRLPRICPNRIPVAGDDGLEVESLRKASKARVQRRGRGTPSPTVARWPGFRFKWQNVMGDDLEALALAAIDSWQTVRLRREIQLPATEMAASSCFAQWQFKRCSFVCVQQSLIMEF